MKYFGQGNLSKHDMISVTSLIEYLATFNGISERSTHFLVQTEFNVSDITKIKNDQYDRLIGFLVDLQAMGVH